MKKLAMAVMLATFTITPFAAMAADQDDVDSDKGAIMKDNAALAKDNATLQKDRMDKAADKATDSYGKQAGASLAIGADKTMIEEKKMEKSVDQKILNHDANNMKDDDKSDQ